MMNLVGTQDQFAHELTGFWHKDQSSDIQEHIWNIINTSSNEF